MASTGVFGVLIVCIALVWGTAYADEESSCPCDRCADFDSPDECNDDLGDTLLVSQTTLSVGEVMDAIVSLIEEGEFSDKGIKVFARIDHAAEAEERGLELKPAQVLIFGNPSRGTQLMADTPSSAIDLPLRVAAWEDEEGMTNVGYYRPVEIASRHCIELDLKELLCSSASMVAALVAAAL